MKTKLLVVSMIPSHPPYSGNRKRIYSLLNYLKSQSITIDFLFYDQNGKNRNSYLLMQQAWDRFDVVVDTFLLRNIRRSSRYFKKLLKHEVPLNDMLDSLCGESLIKAVEKKLKKESFNAILVEYVYLSKVFEFIDKRMLKIIDTNDVFSDRNKRLLQDGISRASFSISPADEKLGLKRADVVIAIQKEELELFKSVNGPLVIEVGHIAEEKFIKRQYSTLKSVGIIAGNDIVNRHSVKKFLELVDKKNILKEVDIYIAGPVCDSLGEPASNVKLMGKIDSLEDFFTLADIYVTPTISGTGLKIKSIEALSYGVPLFSTAEGIIGIETECKEHQFNQLEDLVDALEHYYLKQIELGELHITSVECFNHYRERIQKQLDSLVGLIKNNHSIKLNNFKHICNDNF